MKSDQAVSIPVLVYHHVLPRSRQTKADWLAVPEDLFELQIHTLVQEGYSFLTPAQFWAFKQQKRMFPVKSILITFDDGWLDNYLYAFPILKKYHIPMTCFLASGLVEDAALCSSDPSKSMINLQQMKEMHDSGLVHFQCHTHRHLSANKKLEDLEQDLMSSIQFFQQHLGYRPNHLCWPYGHYNSTATEIGKRCEFDMFYTLQRGLNLADSQMDQVCRFAVKDNFLWLLRARLFIFSHPWANRVYQRLRLRKK